MNNFRTHKIIAFFLAVLMILHLIPAVDLTVFAEGADDGYESHIGQYATLDSKTSIIDVEPDTTWQDNSWQIFPEDFSDGSVFRIDDYKLLTEEYSDGVVEITLWYQISLISGTVLSKEFYSDGFWVLQRSISGSSDTASALSLFVPEVAEGNVSILGVSSLSMEKYDKPTLTAVSAKGSVAAYTWQIEYASGKWVDIYGEDSATVKLSYGMVASILAANGTSTVNVRCKSTYAGETIYSAAVPVTVYESSTYSISIPRAFADDTTSAAETEKTTYSVIINYQFADGEPAAAPWTVASLNEGYHLKQTIVSPTVVGYEPKEIISGGIDVGNDPENIAFDVIVNNNISITVTYQPVNVNYTVEHRFQPVSGSDNVEDYLYFGSIDSETKQGLTGSSVGEGHELTGDDLPAGFYALLYDTTTTIAADGTTVITVYYDRYFYLMNFDLAGGYGAEPIYARVGTPLTGLIKTPIKAGYVFSGWRDTAGNVYTVDNFPYSTMPANNTAYTAQWTPGTTTYDVVFWYENANDDGYTQVGAATDIGATAGDVVNGSTYKDTDFDGRDDRNFTYSHADTNVEVRGDGSTVVNVYFKRNVYTVTFYMEDCASTCPAELHTHTDDCRTLICSLTEHDHVSLGCTLNCDHTIHDISCYSGERGSLVPVSKPNYTLTHLGNSIYSYYSSNRTRYVLNIGNEWYQDEYGSRYLISLNCSHIHTDTCYSCNQFGHIHSDSCYYYNCGKQLHYHSNGDCYYVVTAKYDADISASWKTNPVQKLLDEGWVFESSITGDYYSFLEKMPGYELHEGENITMIATKWSDDYTYRWYYYLETYPGMDKTGLTIRNDGNKEYYLYDDTTVTYSGTGLGLTYDEDYYPITGFDQRDEDVPDFTRTTIDGKTVRVAYLYYTRNSYNLSFSNHGTVVSGKGGTFLYEQDISNQDFVPDYPSTLEPNAYVFDGWYESPFFGDTKFDFTTTDADGNTVKATMPARNLTLYARWVPKNHTVNIYLTDELTDNVKVKGENGTQVVEHRATATNPYPDVTNNPPVHPTNNLYKFVGWFYMDGNTEKAFDFSMPVTQDLDLYAKWSSNVLVEYVIHYQLADGTPVAPDTKGSALAGSSKTFEAKTGDQLNEGYRTGYFPATQSSCVVRMSLDDKNEFTFIYVAKPSVNYTVKHVIKETGEVWDEETKSTSDAIVTESFKVKTGYMPDAYSKSLVLTADASKNVITFYYTKDDVHAPVHVVHMIQNAEGENYTLYQEFTDLNGVINNLYTTAIQNIDGYDFSHATAGGSEALVDGSSVSGIVTTNGLEIIIYYNREIHPYEFRFVEKDTDNELADPVTGTGRYGAQVSCNAKSIEKYTLVSAETQSMIIEREDGTTAVKNVRVFEYVERTFVINYKPVGPAGATGFGSVSTLQEIVSMVIPEADGSTATPTNYYNFVGWYLDEACTQKVDVYYVDSNFDEATIKPNPNKNPEAYFSGITFYAKFEEKTVTINYFAVGPENLTGFGGINDNQTQIVSQSGIGMVTGQPAGATAVPNGAFQFVGWYDNAECKGNPLNTNATYVPSKTDGTVWVDGTTYYAKFVEIEVTINYVAVGPNKDTINFGKVDPTINENVKVLTGTPSSTADPEEPVFKFVGWYLDEACTTPVSSDWVRGTQINPGKTKDYGNGVMGYVSATYYAKFEYNLTSLTITKTGWNSADSNQTFIFNIKGTTDDIDIDVTVHGNGSVTVYGLTVSSLYTITEKTDWSWRYNVESAAHKVNATDATSNLYNDPNTFSYTVQIGLDGTFTFNNTRKTEYWLDGDSWCDNRFMSIASQAIN